MEREALKASLIQTILALCPGKQAHRDSSEQRVNNELLAEMSYSSTHLRPPLTKAGVAGLWWTGHPHERVLHVGRHLGELLPMDAVSS